MGFYYSAVHRSLVSVGRIFLQIERFSSPKENKHDQIDGSSCSGDHGCCWALLFYPGYSHPQVAIAPSLTYAYVPGALGNVGTYSVVNVVKRSPEEEGEAEPEPESEPEPSD